MAVRADDIALGDLGEDSLNARIRDHSSDAPDLLGGVAMVKVHRALCKPPTAIGAGQGADLIQDLGVTPPALTLLFDPSAPRKRWA